MWLDHFVTLRMVSDYTHLLHASFNWHRLCVYFCGVAASFTVLAFSLCTLLSILELGLNCSHSAKVIFLFLLSGQADLTGLVIGTRVHDSIFLSSKGTCLCRHIYSRCIWLLLDLNRHCVKTSRHLRVSLGSAKILERKVPCFWLHELIVFGSSGLPCFLEISFSLGLLLTLNSLLPNHEIDCGSKLLGELPSADHVGQRDHRHGPCSLAIDRALLWGIFISLCALAWCH